MAQAEYIRGTASGNDDLLSIIVGWMTGTDGTESHNVQALWTKLADYVDEDTGSGAPMNGDGERCVILRSDIPGELPVYVGLRTFRGYDGYNQQGIQINAYTHFDVDIPWDCQAGSLAEPDRYVSASHFYEGCPAIITGDETICYWLNVDPKRVLCTVRTPVIPQSDNYKKIRQSVCYEQFYLGWAKRIVSKEGYPYPMIAAATTYTLGNSSIGYVQRNFAYNNVLGSIRHTPAFHHDYMMYEGIQTLVFSYRQGAEDPSVKISSRWPFQKDLEGHCGGEENERVLKNVPLSGFSNPICGPSDSQVTAEFSIPCISYGGAQASRIKEGALTGQTVFTYDQMQFANRMLYFDGFWGWYTTYPVRNSYLKSLCWCTYRIQECASHNYDAVNGMTPPLSVYDGGVQHDQVSAHFGWNPSKVVESLSGNRLLIPVYMGIVGSLMEMQSWTRDDLGNPDYDEEQKRIQVAGVMDGVYFVPGLGLSAQDVLKVNEESNLIEYLVIPDVYRRGAYNYSVMRLGSTEWHEENPGSDTPRDNG